MEEQANLPGTIDEHPNWRRKLPVDPRGSATVPHLPVRGQCSGRRTASPAMTPPTATYRLQLRGGMTFARAATLAPQLANLGISHLYLSPIFEAVSGSTHGYDVVDATVIDGVLGGEAGFSTLADACRSHGIGLILDFVPNHMAASPQIPGGATCLSGAPWPGTPGTSTSTGRRRN